MLNQEVIDDPFFHGYEYLGTVLIVNVPLWGKNSTVKTFQSYLNNTNIQVHQDSGYYRVRAAPTREYPFPEYGAWQK